MKRHISSKDLSPRLKRSRNIASPEIDYYMHYRHSDYDRREPVYHDSRRSPDTDHSYRSERTIGHHIDHSNDSYRSLCISNINPKYENKSIEDFLKKEYKQFGDFNVKFAIFNGERVAYMNFRYPEHARKARHGIPKLYMEGRLLRIQPMYASIKRRSPSPYDRRTSGSGGGGGGHSSRPSSSLHDQYSHRKEVYRQSSPDSKSKRDGKFPYHLDHLDPEDDLMATRTLFVGNLAPDISDEEIIEIFEKYGFVEDIDIKRPNKGTGNAYAFVRYTNLDMAHRAKVDMSGRMIKSLQCKIGYGKVTPTNCIWVGGLGPWIQYDVLEHEFERFGKVEQIEWPQGKNYSYIVYDNVESAIRACTKMRGYPLGGLDKRIRVDYGDVEHIHNDPSVRRTKLSERLPSENRLSRTNDRGGRNGSLDPDYKRSANRGRDSRSSSARRHIPNEPLTVETSTTISDLASCLPSVWNGLFFLKNSNFGCRMHILSGDESLVDQFMKRGQSSDHTKLSITQRMKLDPIKLDDVSQRIKLAGNHGFCVMLAIPATVEETGNSQPPRPLKNLIGYLRSKDSAGVVFLNSTDDTNPNLTGVLHAFPPCEFGQNLLTQKAIGLSNDIAKDDHLVVLLIRSSTA